MNWVRQQGLAILAILLFTIAQAMAAPNYTITQVTNNFFDDKYPQINNEGHVVWRGSDASAIDLEIYLYTGTKIIQITDNTFSDLNPKINDNGYIVWERYGDGPDYEIFLYDGT
ncbi:MAG: hypothetical protein ABFS05_14190, partial [Bacteroidota bacterium]